MEMSEKLEKIMEKWNLAEIYPICQLIVDLKDRND